MNAPNSIIWGKYPLFQSDRGKIHAGFYMFSEKWWVFPAGIGFRNLPSIFTFTAMQKRCPKSTEDAGSTAVNNRKEKFAKNPFPAAEIS